MKKLLICCLLLAVLAAAVLLPRAADDLSAQSVGAIRQAVLQSAAQCYAVEGVYPASLVYLEAHYGLVLNHRRYIITYDAFSSNLPPDVAVLIRGREDAS